MGRRPASIETKRGWKRNNDYRRFYGITLAQYEAMLEAQGGLCALCGEPETVVSYKSKEPLRLMVDHDHESGQVRALLCHSCNRGIGFYEKWRVRAEVYLSQFAPVTVD